MKKQKQLVNLSERFDFVPKTVTYNECVKARLEDGYTLTFRNNPIPNTDGMDYIKKHITVKRYNSGRNSPEDGYVIKYNNGGIFIGIYQKKMKLVGKSIFSKLSWMYVIRYDRKKVIASKGRMPNSIYRLALEYMGLEGIVNEFNKRRLTTSDYLYGKTVLKAIFTGKVTNFDDLLKVYITSTYKLKVGSPQYNDIKEEIKNRYHEPGEVIQIMNFSTSIKKAFQLSNNSATGDLYKDNREKWYIFWDLLKDAQMLDLKINPEWSLSRMNQEHEKNNERLMLLEEGTLDTAPIHETDTVIDDKIQGMLLNSEKEVFKEASLMHHCLYTHYFERIKNKRYIALSLTSPERCTVGIRYTEERGFELEQVHTIYNGCVSSDTFNLINEYIQMNRERLNGLSPQKTQSKQTVKQEQEDFQYAEDLPF